MNQQCPDVEQWLMPYIENRLSDAEKHEMQMHLADCEECLETFIILKRLELDNAYETFTPQKSQAVGSYMNVLKKKMFRLAEWLFAMPEDWPFQPAFGHLRGSDGNLDGKDVQTGGYGSYQISFNGIDASLLFENTGDEIFHVWVKVLEKGKKPESIIRIVFEKAEADGGDFSDELDGEYVAIEDIPYGEYSFIVEQDGVEIGKSPVIIDHEGIHYQPVSV